MAKKALQQSGKCIANGGAHRISKPPERDFVLAKKKVRKLLLASLERETLDADPYSQNKRWMCSYIAEQDFSGSLTGSITLWSVLQQVTGSFRLRVYFQIKLPGVKCCPIGFEKSQLR